MTEELARGRVVAYRVAALGLGEAPEVGVPPAVLALGVQDTPHGSARLALAARGVEASPAELGLALVWGARGAPHYHPAGELVRLAAGLWPLNDADARARLLWTESRHEVLEVDALSAFRLTAGALRDVVRAPMTKGEASAAVTAGLPEELSAWCERCRARHVQDGLFRQSALLGGVGLVRDGSDLHLAPLPSWPHPTPPPDPTATAAVILAYLRALGPASRLEAATFLGTAANPLTGAWPTDHLVEVRAAGRRALLPEDCLQALRTAPPPAGVRLLPPSDPYLQARDRTLLLPSRHRRAALWRPLASPGAVLVDGEIAGTWRGRTGKSGYEVTVTAFDPLPTHASSDIEAAAARIAALRGEEPAGVRQIED